MKEFQILRVSNSWSTKTLKEDAEKLANEKSAEGWEIVSVSFGFTSWFSYSFYITIAREK